MIKRIILILLLLMLTMCMYAQSVFSFQGPAEMYYTRDVFSEGMGGTGSGDLFRRNTGLVNPSLSTTYNRTNFSTAFIMGHLTYKNKTSSFKDDQGYLPYFNLIIPIKQHRFVFHYNTISTGKLNTENSTEVSFDNNDTYEILEEQKIDFSLYRASVFYANKNKVLNFGFGVSYLFGHRVHYHKQSYTESQLSNAIFEQESLFKNPTLNIGVSKIINKFSVGIAGSLPAKLKGDHYYKTNTLNEKTGDFTYEYPATLNFGLTFKPAEYFSLSTDIDYENWKETDNFDSPENSARVAFGISWDSYKNDDNFLKNIPVRLGISHRNLPFKVNNSSINELAYHFGISFPLKQYDSYLDLGLKIYSRADMNKHNYEETGFLFSIGTQGFDFLRKPLDRKAPRDIPKPDNRSIF